MGTTRQRIVAATTDLFRQRGYNGTSLTMITNAADATNGSLYHFFPGGKEQLATAVVEESGAAYFELFELFADANPNLANAFVDFFEAGAQFLEDTGFVDPCPIGTIAREAASVNEVLRQSTDRVLRSWIDGAGARFERAGVDPHDAADLATAVVAIIEGGFVLARAARASAPFRACGRQVHRLLTAQLPVPVSKT